MLLVFTLEDIPVSGQAVEAAQNIVIKTESDEIDADFDKQLSFSAIISPRINYHRANARNKLYHQELAMQNVKEMRISQDWWVESTEWRAAIGWILQLLIIIADYNDELTDFSKFNAADGCPCSVIVA